MNATYDLHNIIKNLRCKVGASEKLIKKSMSELGIDFPRDYIAFLKLANGAKGSIGDSYISLWSMQDLANNNKGYEVEQYAPGFLLFGSDGGGNAYAFNTLEDPMTVYRLPFIGMSKDTAEYISDSFTRFLADLSRKGEMT